MNDARPFGPRPGQQVLLKENPAAYLGMDAAAALEQSRQAQQAGNDAGEASFARGAILLYFIALEGLVNFAYEWSEVPGTRWRRWSVAEKWRRVAVECLPCLGVIEGDGGAVLYRRGDPCGNPLADQTLASRFLELKAFRNLMVHVRPVFASLTREEVTGHLQREEIFPISKLPKRVASVRYQHAEIAAAIHKDMTDALKGCFHGLAGHWLDEPATVEFVTDDDWGSDDE